LIFNPAFHPKRSVFNPKPDPPPPAIPTLFTIVLTFCLLMTWNVESYSSSFRRNQSICRVDLCECSRLVGEDVLDLSKLFVECGRSCPRRRVFGLVVHATIPVDPQTMNEPNHLDAVSTSTINRLTSHNTTRHTVVTSLYLMRKMKQLRRHYTCSTCTSQVI